MSEKVPLIINLAPGRMSGMPTQHPGRYHRCPAQVHPPVNDSGGLPVIRRAKKGSGGQRCRELLQIAKCERVRAPRPFLPDPVRPAPPPPPRHSLDSRGRRQRGTAREAREWITSISPLFSLYNTACKEGTLQSNIRGPFLKFFFFFKHNVSLAL